MIIIMIIIIIIIIITGTYNARLNWIVNHRTRRLQKQTTQAKNKRTAHADTHVYTHTHTHKPKHTNTNTHAHVYNNSLLPPLSTRHTQSHTWLMNDVAEG